MEVGVLAADDVVTKEGLSSHGKIFVHRVQKSGFIRLFCANEVLSFKTFLRKNCTINVTTSSAEV